MNPAPLLVGLALAVSGLAPGHSRVPRAQPVRPVILLVHGRGFLTRDSALFHRQALEALRAGAFRATGDSLLTDADVRLVWYADVMDVRRRSARSLTSCDRHADSTDTGLSPSFILRSLALVASELIDASAVDSVGEGARDLAGDLRFIGDPGARCAAEGRVADALARAHAEGRPVVLVGHSLGALVAWGHLQHRSAGAERDVPEVQRLVTVGSPIGNPELRELLFGETAEVSLPRGVRSWVNALNADDPFAARLVTPDSAPGPLRARAGITDVVTGHADEDAHDLHGYLRDAGTAKAVIGAWCEVADNRKRIAGCIALSRH